MEAASSMPSIPHSEPRSLFEGSICDRCGFWRWIGQPCRECKRRKDRKSYQKHREKRLEYCKAYAAANADKIREYNQSEARKAAFRAYEQKPESKAKRTAYRKAHPELYKEADAKHYAKVREDEAFKERARARAKAWAEANAERVRAYNRSESRRATYKINNNRRRAAGTLTKKEWLAILESYAYSCAYCGRDDCPMQIEHIVAVSKGGLTVRENIVPACEPCNKRKQAQLWTPRPPKGQE
jgi:5-methylcytosine-specific restriction endonuclease McrA